LEEEKVINIVVYDWNFFGKDDVCGTATVCLLEHDLLEAKVHPLTVQLHPQGELKITLAFEDTQCLFGMDIEQVCLREGTDVPMVVTKCIAEIDARGLEEGTRLFVFLGCVRIHDSCVTCTSR
jgi:hypothetical protein